MKSLMLLLALGLASSDKLDRTYLPPPGSKIAGGSDGALQVPLEFPKQTYSTSVRPPIPGQLGDPQPTIGLGLPNIPPGPPDLVSVTPGPKTLFDDLQNKVPTTTTSYAFTQTTTFPPPEGFETTVNAIGSTGFPSDVSHDFPNGVYTPSGHSQGYPQPSGPAHVQPGTQIVQHPRLPTVQPGYPTPAQTPIGHPGYSQPSIIQYLPGQTSSTTVSPISGSPPGLPQTFSNQDYTQQLGVQLPRQFGQQVLSSLPAAQDVSKNYLPGTSPAYYGNAVRYPVAPESIAPQQIGGQRLQNLGQQILQPTTLPGVQYVTDNQGNIVPITSSQELARQRPLFGGQQGPIQPSISPQLINNILEPNLPQQLGGQQPIIAYPQSGTYPQYSNVVPGSNISQPFVQALNQQQGPYAGIPQYQVALNNQGDVIPGSTIPQVISPQPQYINQPGFTPATLSPQGITSTYQPGSSQPGFIQPSVDQRGMIQPGVFHTGYNPASSYQPGSTQSPAVGNIAQTTVYPGYPAQVNPAKPSIFPQPTQGSLNQNTYQTNDQKFPLRQHPDRPDVQSIYELDSTGPTSVLPAGYNQPSYSSTTPGIIPGYNLPSTTISPIRIPSSTTYPVPGQTYNIPGKILRPERPQAEFDRNAEILNYKNILTPDGEFEYSFDTSNGIHADENGTSIDGVKAEGSYSYIGDDGKLYSVVYSADENGFQPQGAHLPTPPPIPDAIQKVIEQVAKDKEAGISHDGFYDDNKYGHKKYQSPNRIRPQQQDKFTTNGASTLDDYDEAIRHGQTKPSQVKPGRVRPDQIREGQVIPGRVRPGQFKPGTKGDDSQTHRKPNIAADVDEYDEYILNSEEHDYGDLKIPSNRIPSNRPLDTQHNKYTYDGDRHVMSDKKPLSTVFGGDNKDRYLPGVTDSPNRYQTTPGRKPISRPGLSKDIYQSEGEEVNENEDMIKDYQKDRLPTTRPEMRYYDQDEQKVPGKFDREYPVTRRPVGTKRPVSTTMRHNEEQEFTSRPGIHQVKQPGRRPLKPSPGSTYRESEYNGDYNKNNVPASDIDSGKPQGSRRPDSQRPEQPGLPPYDVTDENDGDIYGHGSVSRPYDQERESMKSKYPSHSGNKDTGYQYLPPQRKFPEIDTIQTGHTPEVTLGFDTKRPGTKGVYDEKTTTQAFMPSDIYRDEGTFYENTDNVAPSRKPVKKPGLVTTSPDEYASTVDPSYDKEDMTSQPQYDDKYSTDGSIQQDTRPGHGGSKYPKPSGQQRPGQVYPDESGESSKIPSYIMSSTTPMPSRGRDPTKVRPQYVQTYDQPFPSSTAIPGMRIPGRLRPVHDETIIPGSSTITPSQADISRPSSRLPYQYGDRTTPGLSRASTSRPGQRIDFSTTPKSETYSPGTFTSESDRIYTDQIRPGNRPENFGDSRRPNTYYPDTVTPGSSTIRPASTIPGRSGIQNVPSTTYRPKYTIIDQATGRPITVDAFGTPVSTTYKPEYSVNQGPNTGFDRPTQGPGTSRVQTRPPGLGFQRPGSQVSSTTERIIGEDFSGPKQPQRFDPNTGYHY